MWLWFNFDLVGSSNLVGWHDILEVCTAHSTELSHRSLNLEPAINCHPGVSQAAQGVDVRAVRRKDVHLGDPSAGFVR